MFTGSFLIAPTESRDGGWEGVLGEVLFLSFKALFEFFAVACDGVTGAILILWLFFATVLSEFLDCWIELFEDITEEVGFEGEYSRFIGISYFGAGSSSCVPNISA